MKFLILALCLCGTSATGGRLVIPQYRLPAPDGFAFPESVKELDVYETGRIDLDGDGQPEQLVIDSSGGTGGPVWHIRRIESRKRSQMAPF